MSLSLSLTLTVLDHHTSSTYLTPPTVRGVYVKRYFTDAVIRCVSRLLRRKARQQTCRATWNLLGVICCRSVDGYRTS